MLVRITFILAMTNLVLAFLAAAAGNYIALLVYLTGFAVPMLIIRNRSTVALTDLDIRSVSSTNKGGVK